MGQWCKVKGKKVRTSHALWKKKHWFKKYGVVVENGKKVRYTFKSLTQFGNSDGSWDFGWFDVVINDNHWRPRH